MSTLNSNHFRAQICPPVGLSVERDGWWLAGRADGGGPGLVSGAARPDLARYVLQGRVLVATGASAQFPEEGVERHVLDPLPLEVLLVLLLLVLLVLFLYLSRDSKLSRKLGLLTITILTVNDP